MDRDLEYTLSWMRVGGWGGLAGIAAYLAAAFAPLPDLAGYACAFAFGPLVAVGALGLRQALSLHRRSPVVDLAAVFAVGAGFTVLAMLTVQQAIFAKVFGAGAEVEAQLRAGLNAVHFGLDVAWDVLIGAATVLLGWAMLGHPRFGRVLGSLGIILGGLLLGFNLGYFPTPPDAAGSIDWGPFVALWMVATNVLLLRALPWARALLEPARRRE